MSLRALASGGSRVLEQVESVADIGGLTNTAYAALASMSITFAPRENPFWVEFFTPRQVVGGTFNAFGDAVFVYTQFWDGAAQVGGEAYWSGRANLDGSGAFLHRAYFDVADFTPGEDITISVRTKQAAVSVETPTHAVSGPMYLRAFEAPGL